MRRTARKSLDALTGARFFAAFWVVCYHFASDFRLEPLPGKPAANAALPSGVGLVLLQGHLAVDFFFLLSGFILAYTYVTPGGTLRGSSREFWVARIARIYPVYLLGLVLALPEYLTVEPNHAILAVSGVAHLTMLHAWLPFTLDWNQPSWSLSVESFFYLLFPLVLPLAGRLRRAGLWLLLAAAWLWFMAVDFALVIIGKAGLASGANWNNFARYNPLISFPEFIAGMALGLLFVRYGADALPLLR
ncbi:MAG TPA: acyltransferase, partial [Ktedonobacterales bacterium]|nr:acyltransferase [Ktedonobacterales bacterium]